MKLMTELKVHLYTCSLQLLCVSAINCVLLLNRESTGQRAALYQTEGEVHRAGPGSRRLAEEGEEEESIFMSL